MKKLLLAIKRIRFRSYLQRKQFAFALAILIGAWFQPKSASASAGGLDTSFGAGGIVTTSFPTSNNFVHAAAIQADGKIVVVGATSHAVPDFTILRYNNDGSLDSGFGMSGKVTTDFFGGDDTAFAIAIQSDGKIVIAGSASNNQTGSHFALARYNPDGSLDSGFGTGGKVATNFSGTSGAFALVIQPDGKLVAAGSQTAEQIEEESFNTSSDFLLVRYQPDGTPDSGFGSAGIVTTDFGSVVENHPSDCGESSGPWPVSDFARAIVLQPDNKIVVAGVTRKVFSCVTSDRFALARYSTDGTLDAAFGTGGLVISDISLDNEPNVANAVAIQGDGRVLAAGTISNINSTGDDSFAVARFNTDGTLDSGFGTAGVTTTDFSGDGSGDTANGVAIQPDGKIIAVGYSGISGTNFTDFALARYNPEGSLDPAFGNGGKVTTDIGTSDQAYAVAIQPDGKIVVAGDSDNHSEGGVFALARYLTSNVNTPTGTNVTVQPVDSTNGTTPVILTFSNVSQEGNTTLTTSNTGFAPPAGFSLGDPATYYDLATTASFSGSIVLCIDYTGVSLQDETQLRLFHFENGVWADRTVSLNSTDDVICANVTSLSPFAIFEDGIKALIGQVKVLNLSHAEKKSLIRKLRTAHRALDRRNHKAAINQFHAFIDEVRALKRRGRLDAAKADSLINQAQGIINTIRGSTFRREASLGNNIVDSPPVCL
jgi:uncharacterized delta-60 repeat protein